MSTQHGHFSKLSADLDKARKKEITEKIFGKDPELIRKFALHTHMLENERRIAAIKVPDEQILEQFQCLKADTNITDEYKARAQQVKDWFLDATRNIYVARVEFRTYLAQIIPEHQRIQAMLDVAPAELKDSFMVEVEAQVKQLEVEADLEQ
ncbi:hypothetical protein NA57DRAFT_76337 [Rhizodiscina lignyota]|uniref:Uncharacterized protein n=1 Tax=Rhizodiscina lignyota TaxID=1504668 RepID=A0A9P4M6C5_9PEZI|nr:hypothetical protein NA57DRAFT_76337 [Rhizodiscina lignyota]